MFASVCKNTDDLIVLNSLTSGHHSWFVEQCLHVILFSSSVHRFVHVFQHVHGFHICSTMFACLFLVVSTLRGTCGEVLFQLKTYKSKREKRKHRKKKNYQKQNITKLLRRNDESKDVHIQKHTSKLWKQTKHFGISKKNIAKTKNASDQQNIEKQGSVGRKHIH